MDHTINHTQIIQTLIDKYNYQSYLEIGIEQAVNFNAIRCPIKIGVDPNSVCYQYLKGTDTMFCMTSDDFFRMEKWNFQDKEIYLKIPVEKFDIVFVDGLHHWKQVQTDIKNALLFLNEGGTIVVHDCCPENEFQQMVPRQQKIWTGDGWKAWVKLRTYLPVERDVEMFVLNCDYGCGIIRKNPNHPIATILVTEEEINWENFEKNKKEWLHLVEPDLSIL